MRTFTLYNQDHTLGAALRAVIGSYKDVEFVGYSIPHPSVPELSLRIQTYETPAHEVLKRAFEDIITICDIIEAKFKMRMDEFAKLHNIENFITQEMLSKSTKSSE